MTLVLYLFFCIINFISSEDNGSFFNGNFTMEFYDEFGSKCLETNLYQKSLWIRLRRIGDIKKECLWLKIKKKEKNDYPILIKAVSGKTYNYSTRSPSIDCHFIAASYLIPVQHVDTLFKDVIPLVDISDYLPISLCDGISGIASLADEKGLVRIESSNDESPVVHLTYIPKLLPDDVSEMKGFDQLKDAADGVVHRGHERVKRSFRMPVHNMPGPFLVELYLIVDSTMARTYQGNNYFGLLSRIKSIMNQINVAFMQFNIYFTVVQLEIWEQDQIKLTDENHILMELQLYKRQFIKIRHDCLHAILGENLGSARRGQSEPASMCAYSRCVGYTKDHQKLKELEIAHSVMHEIGHNFGLYHDTERCQCVGCIMATGVEFGSLKFQWSNCSRKQMPSLLNSGMNDCLKDGPVSDLGDFNPIIMSHGKLSRRLGVASMSECGNGVVDDGEQCDCGGRSMCSAVAMVCCNPDTCRLQPRATCASGDCCDLTSCLIRTSGTVCRSVSGRDCDLPEYCNGSSEWCPADVHKSDGYSCITADVGDASHCYHGLCQSRQSSCRVLFGNTGYEASSKCYDMNTIGSEVKNCGLVTPVKEELNKHPKGWEPIKCTDENLMCGRLWCSHENERTLRSSPQFEVEEVVAGYHCSAARFYLDWFMDDAGMVPNGSPCGYGKMCWRGACIHSQHREMGGCYCHGHGECNNRGHCHCFPGFAPPNCTGLGNGGSVDSGPMPEYHRSYTLVVTGVLIALVLLVSVLALATLIYHYNTRRWPPIFAKLKFLDYQKSDSVTEFKEENKFENNYSKFTVPADDRLCMTYEAKTSRSTRAPQKSPTSPIPLIRDDGHGTDDLVAKFTGERTVTPNPKKPSTVKSRAIMFEKVPQGVSQLRPAVSKDKPSKHSRPCSPPPLGNKPGRTPTTGTKPGMGPPTIAKPLVPEKQRLTVEGPPLLSTKPGSTRMVPGRSWTGRSKANISQPKLEQTTCTDKTHELPHTDQTLSRNVGPHKILRVDSITAVKYLY